MKAYITSKIVKAHPAEKDGQPGYAVYYPDNYISWCPKAEFERVSREITIEEINLAKNA